MSHRFHPQLIEHLTNGGLLLTPNKRLSKYLFNHIPLQTGLVVEQMQIQPLEAFINELCDQLLPTPHLLTADEHFQIWHSIIAKSESHRPNSQIEVLATGAQQAENLINLWLDDTSQYKNHDPLFEHWFEQYSQYCKTHRVTSSSSRQRQLANFDLTEMQLPAILISGFIHIPNCYSKILSALSYQTLDSLYTNTNDRQPSKLLAFKNDREQIQAACQWAYEQWQQKPQQNIAIVCPTLTTHGALINASLGALKQNNSSLDWNISTSLALADSLPMKELFNALELIASLQSNQSYALEHLLQWWQNQCFWPELTPVALQHSLTKSVLNTCAKHCNFLQFTRAIQKQLRQWLETSASNTQTDHQTLLQNSLQAWEDFLQWAKVAQANFSFEQHQQWLLGKLFEQKWPSHYPQHHSTDSNMLQACLKSLVTILINHENHLTRAIPTANTSNTSNFYDWLSCFKHAAKNQASQPLSFDAPIQFLGKLEALNLPFDALLILDFDTQQWPEKPTFHNMLSIHSQKSAHCPRSDALQEWHIASDMLNRLQALCPNILLSYVNTKEGIENAPSTFLDAIDHVKYEYNASHKSNTTNPQSERHLELIEDFTHQRVMQHNIQQQPPITGGSGLVKDQAHCPFRAFFKHRIGIQALPTPQYGLPGSIKGQWLHLALQYFWEQTPSHQALCDLKQDELEHKVELCLFKAAQTIARQFPIEQACFMEVETSRQKHMVMQALELDKSREPFEVAGVELAQEITLANTPITLRLDRIDQLADGRYFLLDYKTANCSPNDWLSEPMKEPQLPLYCVALKQPISGIAFIQVTADKATLKALTDTQNPTEFSWENLQTAWEKQLNTLVQNFEARQATIQPAFGNQSCQYCDYMNLCRIHVKQPVTTQCIERAL